MPAEDEMTIDERWKYLRKMQKRYVKADRDERGRLLDSDLERKVHCAERGETYGPEVDDA